MKPTKLVSALAAIGFGVGLTLAAGPASAVITLFSPITAYQDDNLDFVVDNNTNGLIDTGDRIISAFELANTQGILAGQGPNAIGPEELTGVADITVATVLANGTLVFAPSGAAGVLSGFAAGTMVALWTDATPDLNLINAACGTRANCLTLAGLGAADGECAVPYGWVLSATVIIHGMQPPRLRRGHYFHRAEWRVEHCFRWLQLRTDCRLQQYGRDSRAAGVRAVLRYRSRSNRRSGPDHRLGRHPRRPRPHGSSMDRQKRQRFPNRPTSRTWFPGAARIGAGGCGLGAAAQETQNVKRSAS